MSDSVPDPLPDNPQAVVRSRPLRPRNMVAEERSSLPTPDPRTTRARPAQAAATSTLRPLATTPVQPTISSSNEPTFQPTEPPTDQLSDQPSDTVPDQPATQPSVQNVTQSTTSRSGSRPVPPVVQPSNPTPEHPPTRHRRRSESPAAPEDGEYQSTRRRTGLTQPENRHDRLFIKY